MSSVNATYDPGSGRQGDRRHRQRLHIWRSFENHYWLALYLVDATGTSGSTASARRPARKPSGPSSSSWSLDDELVHVDAGGLAEAADWGAHRSPETYVGHARLERRSDRRADALALALNQWALAGEWRVDEEAAVLDTAGGSIAHRPPRAPRPLHRATRPPAAR